ncbi:hypothetical protein GCM10010833_08690 [Blastomonas aquatica]|uniref:Uncharacterized protein n=1 Tax=Blastomonas aquatica TaxID=1510276 RepID=A0ABQ1J119_9SPHN|nr:hypothetical protein GCM10010833_08690 [Blastomonas aquatica]
MAKPPSLTASPIKGEANRAASPIKGAASFIEGEARYARLSRFYRWIGSAAASAVDA